VPGVTLTAGAARAASDAAGRFAFPGLEGTFTLGIAGEDWILASRIEEVATPVDHLRVVVAPPRRQRIRVRDVAGRAVAGAYVALGPHDEGWPGATLGPTRHAVGWSPGRTDERGEAVIQAPAMPLDLLVTAVDRYFHDEIDVVPADAEEYEVVLGPRHADAALVVRVDDRAGRPVAGAKVHAHGAVMNRTGTTGEDGRAELFFLSVRDPPIPRATVSRSWSKPTGLRRGSLRARPCRRARRASRSCSVPSACSRDGSSRPRATASGSSPPAKRTGAG
jgi:hypothetical protein